MPCATSAEECPVTRVIATLMRGGFRMMLGLAIAISVVYAILWLLETALKSGAIGSAGWWSSNIWLDLGLALGLALPIGIASAIACDRAWVRVRRVGPKLSSKR